MFRFPCRKTWVSEGFEELRDKNIYMSSSALQFHCGKGLHKGARLKDPLGCRYGPRNLEAEARNAKKNLLSRNALRTSAYVMIIIFLNLNEYGYELFVLFCRFLRQGPADSKRQTCRNHDSGQNLFCTVYTGGFFPFRKPDRGNKRKKPLQLSQGSNM